MNILIATLVAATPTLLGILAVMAVVNLIVLIGTHDDRRKIAPKKRQHRLTWDLTRDTRFINLD